MAPYPALPDAPPAAAPEALLRRPRFFRLAGRRVQAIARRTAKSAGGSGTHDRRRHRAADPRAPAAPIACRRRLLTMLVDVKVPQLSESVAEATLVTWHKQAGDFVNRD